MKDIMHNAGTIGRFAYLGPAEGQMALANFSNLSDFKDYLLKKFGGDTLSFEDIRIKTVNETTYLKKDYRNALKELENDSKIFIQGKGEKGGIKDESMVSFDPKIIEERMIEEKKNGENKKTKNQYTFDEF